MNTFPQYNNLLVGELGSVNKYEKISTDFSLNVTNSYSVAFLHSLGVNKVTLSHELNKAQIENLVSSYINRYNKRPNLELIIFGRVEAMISKFNLNELYAVENSYLQDRFNNLYPILVKNNLMRIYDYKRLFIENYEQYFDIGINNLRFNILLDNDLDECLKLFNRIF